MAQALQRSSASAGDRGKRGEIADLVRLEHLDDDEREQPVVPGEVRLEALSSTEQSHRVATRDDLVPLLKAPRCVRGHRYA